MRGNPTWLNTSYDATSSTNSLRNYLIILFTYYDLEGAVFIGDLPIAEYGVENDFSKYGYRTFPIVLFYIDLEGTWLDNALDGDWGGGPKPASLTAIPTKMVTERLKSGSPASLRLPCLVCEAKKKWSRITSTA
jgi:hypothetical protein